MQNQYDVLGVSENTPAEEIRCAYRKLSLQYHPDRNPRGSSLFKSVQRAFEVLGDPALRREHDAQLRAERARIHARRDRSKNPPATAVAPSPFGESNPFRASTSSRADAYRTFFAEEPIILSPDDDCCEIVLDDEDTGD